MVVCCAGHAVLLALGIGGIGVFAAAVSGNIAALVMAVALVGMVGVLAALAFHRPTGLPSNPDPSPPHASPETTQEEQ